MLGWLRKRRARKVWDAGIYREGYYWLMWFRNKGMSHAEDYRNRLDPNLPLDSAIAALLPRGRARILDVGAGPLTVLGKSSAAREIEIVPIDALAKLYDAIMDDVGVTPPVRTRQCDAEELDTIFAEGEFDLAHSQNALDHSYDPMRAIAQMLRVVKPGGYVCLRHNRNEAENEKYEGLHQWNFDVRGGRFVIWNQHGSIDVQQKLDGVADVTAETDGAQIVAKLRKR